MTTTTASTNVIIGDVPTLSWRPTHETCPTCGRLVQAPVASPEFYVHPYIHCVFPPTHSVYQSTCR